jgi:heat shock protein HtpX
MISALRKIEGRGELPGATSAVMELCVDKPREGFADLFATHPSVESRVRALVQYAGGHYEGPLALPMHPTDDQTDGQITSEQPPPLPHGPWSDFNAPANPPGTPPPLPDPGSGPWGNASGPWGRH